MALQVRPPLRLYACGMVESTDIPATNGVIHVIDAVMLPKGL